MNKYSKRALKTTATVGMSLAMVLSAAAPVMATVDNITGTKATVCGTSATNKAISTAKDVLKALLADLKAEEKKLSSINMDTELELTKTRTYLAVAPSDKKFSNFLAAEMLADGSSVANGLALLVDCEGDADAEFIVGSVIASANTGSVTDGERYLGIKNALTDLNAGTSLTALDGAYGEKGNMLGKITTLATYKAEKTKYNNYTDLKEYFGNAGLNDEGKELYNDNMESMLEELNSFSEVNEEIAKDYAKVLKELKVDGNVKYKVVDLIDGAAFPRADLELLENLIKEVKDNKNSSLTAIADFSDVDDSDLVADIVDALDQMVEDIKEVNDTIKSTNVDIKDMKKVFPKLSTLETAIKAYITDDNDDNYDDYQAALAKITEDDLAKTTTYVEDVYGMFYENKAVLRSNGNYVIRTEPTDYARYLNSTDKFDTSVIYLLTTLVDSTDDVTYYDEITENTSDVIKFLKACTTDIEGVKLGNNFSPADAKKIVAANKAYKALVDMNFAGLSTKERRAVKANEELIDALYKKLIFTGTITSTGWVDAGNGDWTYTDESGKAVTKWVAAGKDWYFVQNGNMLRNSWVAQDSTGAKWYYVDNAGKMVSNTTIDGFVIDANGVWTK